MKKREIRKPRRSCKPTTTRVENRDRPGQIETYGRITSNSPAPGYQHEELTLTKTLYGDEVNFDIFSTPWHQSCSLRTLSNTIFYPQYLPGDSCIVFRPERESASRIALLPSVFEKIAFDKNCKFSNLNIFCAETK